MRSTGKVTYGDSYSIGQLTQMWDKSSDFVRGLIERGLLNTDDRGLVTNEELHRFFRESGELLDA